MSEPGTDWEALYQAQETRWDKGFAAPPLVEFLAGQKIEGTVLVPGCGTGHDVRALAAQGARVTGLDFSPSAIRLAHEKTKDASVSYLQADFFHLPTQLLGKFDWVFEHTCFCAIDPSMRNLYVESAAKVLKESGRLLGIFYLNPTVREEEGPPYRVSLNELRKFFAPHFSWEKDWLPSKNYEGREGREWMAILRKKR